MIYFRGFRQRYLCVLLPDSCLREDHKEAGGRMKWLHSQ